MNNTISQAEILLQHAIYTVHRLNLQYDPTADRQPGTFLVALL